MTSITPTKPTTRTTLLAGITITLAAGMLFAGPLDPPAGPVAPSGKTLTEVEPRTAISIANTPGDADSLFKITKPGSYYLTGNITGIAGKHGIEIATSAVTLDLNGFELAGPGTGTFSGVIATIANPVNLTIRNGSIRNWGGNGVDFRGTSAATNSTFADLKAISNGAIGIATDSGCMMTRCTASLNGSHGFSTAFGCMFTECTASGNGGTGISAGVGPVITGCITQSNQLAGIAFSSGVISTCSAMQNSQAGINATSSTVTRCTATSNLQSGISANNCAVTACTAFSNASGFSVGFWTMISNCTTEYNSGDGIAASSSCMVLNNISSSNYGDDGGGTGISVTGAGSRLEDNQCSNCQIGFIVSAAGNLINANVCSGNDSTWELVANNYHGGFLNRVGITSSAISGNSDSSGALDSDNPFRNYTY